MCPNVHRFLSDRSKLKFIWQGKLFIDDGRMINRFRATLFSTFICSNALIRQEDKGNGISCAPKTNITVGDVHRQLSFVRVTAFMSEAVLRNYHFRNIEPEVALPGENPAAPCPIYPSHYIAKFCAFKMFISESALNSLTIRVYPYRQPLRKQQPSFRLSCHLPSIGFLWLCRLRSAPRTGIHLPCLL